MKNTLFLTAILLCFAGTANAQFFKKLGKKIENAAEKTIQRKAEQKTKKETEKAFDSTFNNQGRKKKNTSVFGSSKAEPAASYTFNHKVIMKIKSGKEVMDVHYFLPDVGNFLCAQIMDEKIKDDFYTVFDIEKEAMFTYMENEGKKMKMAVAFKLDNETDNAAIDITSTGNFKTILGYNCQEYKMTGEDMTATIWVTKDTDIRFPSSFYNVKQNKSNNQTWMKDLDGWAMEMIMIDNSKRKPHTIIMNCLSIEDSSMSINSNDYQNIGY